MQRKEKNLVLIVIPYTIPNKFLLCTNALFYGMYANNMCSEKPKCGKKKKKKNYLARGKTKGKMQEEKKKKLTAY